MNLAAELRQMKDNISHVQSLASDKLVGYSLFIYCFAAAKRRETGKPDFSLYSL